MTDQEVYRAFFKLCEKEAVQEYQCSCSKHIGMIASKLVFRGEYFDEDEEEEDIVL